MGNFQKLLARIAQALEKARIPYMVIGGQAVLVHGRPRFTGDIDITLGVDVDALPRIQQITKKLRLSQRRKDVEELARQTNVFPVVEKETNIKVDFIFSFSSYEKVAIQRAKPIKIGRTKAQFATPEDVIIQKIVAGRPVDIADAKSILAAQPSIDKEYVTKWIKKYANIVGRDLVKEFQNIDRQTI